ncbi:ATP-binding protein [Arthrobacter globiformis]|uniref:ATP-binding protein n=1 Tax=Arthrobacter globiformis TaxID=1665 RepID=UPI00277F6B14|nr:ATP-binding protein [Arthrobacter globiformis]MDQ0867280.1 hypothetical protein [Arthrobacter globiformis]
MPDIEPDDRFTWLVITHVLLSASDASWPENRDLIAAKHLLALGNRGEYHDDLPVPGHVDTLESVRRSLKRPGTARDFAENMTLRKAFVARIFGFSDPGVLKPGSPSSDQITGGVFNAVERFIESTGTEELTELFGSLQQITDEPQSDAHDSEAVSAVSIQDPAIPLNVNRVLALGYRLEQALGAFTQVQRDDANRAVDYVRRNVEDGILQRMSAPVVRSNIQVVIGEAGNGKSTLLWGLARRVRSLGRLKPILVSAAWLRGNEQDGPLLEPEDLVAAARSIDNLVVLIDTADLLLHDERARFLLLHVIEQLSSKGARVLLTTRPAEAIHLPEDFGTRVSLGLYDPDMELPTAVRSLSSRFCPDSDAEMIRGSISSAVTRGLPVSSVCRSPLMLRMLFEVSGDSGPLMDLDVTALYELYWKQRVQQDLGPGRDGAASHHDLSRTAGQVALQMLELGSPEVQETEMDSVSEEGGRSSLLLLERRNILTRTGPLLSFFHQTMFEFAAAKTILHRDPALGLQILLTRVLERPSDLFVGAVLEQALILFGKHRRLRPDLSKVLSILCSSEFDSLQGIGLIGVAHNSWVHATDDDQVPGSHTIIEALERLPGPLVRQFLRAIPRIERLDIELTLHQLSAVWGRKEASLCLEVLETANKLRHRYPTQVATWFRLVDCCSYFIDCHPKGLDAPVLLELLEALPGYGSANGVAAVRSAYPRILKKLGATAGRTTFLSILASINRNWSLIGSQEYLDEIVSVVDSVQSGANKAGRPMRPPEGRIVQTALAQVLLAQELIIDEESPVEAEGRWMHRARDLCSDLEQDPRGTRTGARLTSLALYARGLADSGGALKAILDEVMALQNWQALRQLPVNFFAVILERECQAAELLVPRLISWLGFLPVEPNKAKSLQDIQASVARATLADARVSKRSFQAICLDMGSATVERWHQRAWLLSVLPFAAAAGVATANQAVTELTTGQAQLGSKESRDFLDSASDLIVSTPELCAPFVQLAVHQRAAGSLRQVLTNTSADERAQAAQHLRLHRDAIAAMVFDMTRSSNGEQSAAAELLRSLVQENVVNLDWPTLQNALDAATYPNARAVLVRLIHFVQGDSSNGNPDKRLSWIRESVRLKGSVLRRPAPDRRQLPPVLANAFRDSWLMMLQELGGAEDLELAVALCLMPFQTERGPTLDVVGFVPFGKMIKRLAPEISDPHKARDALLHVAMQLAAANYSGKQKRNASSALARAIAPLLQREERQASPALLGALASVPSPFAKKIIQTVAQLAYLQRRNELLSLLHSPIPEDVRAIAIYELRRRGDPTGSSLFPEIRNL